jgi:hypothetical protein
MKPPRNVVRIPVSKIIEIFWILNALYIIYPQIKSDDTRKRIEEDIRDYIVLLIDLNSLIIKKIIKLYGEIDENDVPPTFLGYAYGVYLKALKKFMNAKSDVEQYKAASVMDEAIGIYVDILLNQIGEIRINIENVSRDLEEIEKSIDS